MIGIWTFAREIGQPLNQIAINWLINQESVTSVICGAQTSRHVEESVGSVTWELTSELTACLEEILSPYKAQNQL